MNWIVGDVHGMYSSLRRLLDAVDAADPGARITFTGDYVNRGNDSKKVIDHLLTLKNARFARGNHDDIFDLILHGKCFAEKAAGGTAVLAFQWFMDYGLDRTFHSYGLDWQWLRDTATLPTAERMAHLAAIVPEPHRQFIRNLPAVVEDESFFVVHGYWPPFEPCYPPAVSATVQDHPGACQHLLWGRFRMDEIDAQKPWSKRGFFGHTPIHSYFSNPKKAPMVPIVGPQSVLLDTACAIVTFGRLTAYCVEEDRYLQSSHFGEMVI